MSSNWLDDSQRIIGKALQKLAADHSESVTKDGLIMIHTATRMALEKTLLASPSLPDEDKQRIKKRQASFPDLVDWMHEYFQHVVDDTLAGRLKEFNHLRNLAVHGWEDPESGDLLFDVPQSEYVQAMGERIRQMLRDLSKPAPESASSGVAPPFGAAGAKPQFLGQQPEEEVIIFRRRHLFVLFLRLIPPLLAVVFASLLTWITQEVSSDLVTILLVGFLSLVPAVAWFVWRFIDWENDHYLVTNRRVLHIERVLFTFESRHEAQLDKVQDVSIRIPGPIANLLYFGNVIVETAGTEGQIRFELVPQPRKVQSRILELAPWARGSSEPDGSVGGTSPAKSAFGVLWHLFLPQFPQESAIHVWRKHWIVLMRHAVMPLVLLIVLFGLLLGLEAFALLTLGAQVGIAVGLAFALLWLIWALIDWRNDLYILTPEIVIDIEKMPLIYEQRRQANLRMIQDVSYVQPSLLHKLLDYGDLRLQTAGTFGDFDFLSIPQPRQVQNIIIERLNAARAEDQRREVQRRREEIQDIAREVWRSMEGAGGRGSG